MTPPITPEMLDTARSYSIATGDRVEAVLVRLQERQMRAAGTLPPPPTTFAWGIVDTFIAVDDLEPLADALTRALAAADEIDSHTYGRWRWRR